MNFDTLIYVINSQNELFFYDHERILVAYSSTQVVEPVFVTTSNLHSIESYLDYSGVFGEDGVGAFPVTTSRSITGSINYVSGTSSVTATVLQHFTGTIFPTLVANNIDRCVFCCYDTLDNLNEYIEKSSPSMVLMPGLYHAGLQAADIQTMHNIGLSHTTLFFLDLHSSTRYDDSYQLPIYVGTPYISVFHGKLEYIRPTIDRIVSENSILETYLSVPAAALASRLQVNESLTNQWLMTHMNNSEYVGREYANEQKIAFSNSQVNVARTAHLANNGLPGQVLYNAKTLAIASPLVAITDVLMIHRIVHDIVKAFKDPTHLDIPEAPIYTLKESVRMSTRGLQYIDYSILGRAKPLMGNPINISLSEKVIKSVLSTYSLMGEMVSVSQIDYQTIEILIAISLRQYLESVVISLQVSSNES